MNSPFEMLEILNNYGYAISFAQGQLLLVQDKLNEDGSAEILLDLDSEKTDKFFCELDIMNRTVGVTAVRLQNFIDNFNLL